MQILMTILYIVLFLVFLSVLIIIHELGYLAAAKAFNVYCLEYSIGMGPLLFKHKRKGGETQFSLRAIPFGGYVSMYGEGVPLPEGVVIDEKRSLNNIKAWKRAIVLLAGVTMNAVLALVFFFVSNCFPSEKLYTDSLNISESSVAYNAGIPDGVIFNTEKLTYYDDVSKQEREVYLFDKNAFINNDTSISYAAVLNYERLKSFKDRNLNDYLYVYSINGEDISFDNLVSPSTIDSLTIHFTSLVKDENNKAVPSTVYEVKVTTKDGAYEEFGAQLFYDKYNNTFPEIIKNAFSDFGRCSVILFQTIGDLLTKPATWNNVGGIVAVGFETTSVLQNLGFKMYLFYWGFISVNLAVFNLFPFPGLDGWQLLVLIVEGITRKKIPEKVKNIVSFIGIALLLLLMVIVVVKDIITYIFLGTRLL